MTCADRLRIVAAAVLLTTAGSCSNSPMSPWWERPADQASLAVTALTFTPPALNGGGTAQGTVTIGANAPPGGTRITLTSSIGAAIVPAAVVVPADARSVVFTVTTLPVAADAYASITASLPGQFRSALFPVWAQAQNSLWYASDPDADRVLFKHYLPATATFQAYCGRGTVSVTVRGNDGTSAFVAFTGGARAPSVGSYESASGPNAPFFFLDVGCAFSSSRFVVSESDLTDAGMVRRFVATFEERCPGYTGGRYGELVLTNPPAPSSIVTCLR